MISISPDAPLKQCTKCLQWFPATPEFFNKHSRGGLQPRCNACRKKDRKAYNDTHVEVNRRYQQEHKEEIRIKHKLYYESTKEERWEEKRARDRRYYKTYREKELARGRRHYEENREKERVRSRRYGEKNREKELARQRRYYKTHPETQRARGRMNAQKRRARKEKLEGQLSMQHVQMKLKDQHYACYYCFNKFKQHKDGTYIYHLEHTIPISRPEHSPRHDASYIVLACPHCNLSKRNKLPHEWPQGGRLF